MKKRIQHILAISFLLVAAASFPVFAASGQGHDESHSSGHGESHEVHQDSHTSDHGSSHGEMQHGDHENMILIGEQTVDGVKAVAHLNDVREAMAKAGMKETHHLQVLFTDMAADKTVESGTVAIKITLPSGNTLDPMELPGMEGHFGKDVILTEPGKYSFSVGTKLADGKKRQFSFTTTIH